MKELKILKFNATLIVAILLIIGLISTSVVLAVNSKRTQELGVSVVTNSKSPEKVSSEDIGYSNLFKEMIVLNNGRSLSHKILNGNMVIYKNQETDWKLEAGKTVKFHFEVEDIEGCEDGFKILLGYIKDNVYNDFCTDTLLGNVAIDFPVPEDGEYSFYLLNISASSIYIKSALMEIE